MSYIQFLNWLSLHQILALFRRGGFASLMNNFSSSLSFVVVSPHIQFMCVNFSAFIMMRMKNVVKCEKNKAHQNFHQRAFVILIIKKNFESHKKIFYWMKFTVVNINVLIIWDFLRSYFFYFIWMKWNWVKFSVNSWQCQKQRKWRNFVFHVKSRGT